MVLAADAADVDTLESERMSRDMDVLLGGDGGYAAGRAGNRFALVKRGVLSLVLSTGFVLSAGAQTIVEYIHTDALGSPVATTDASGNVVERQVYESYGAAIAHGPTDGPGFTGHVQDSSTGLSYMQQRYYDPQIGRFLSVDPVAAEADYGANLNRYKYAANNPYRFVDPDGRREKITGSHIAGAPFAGSRLYGGPTPVNTGNNLEEGGSNGSDSQTAKSVAATSGGGRSNSRQESSEQKSGSSGGSKGWSASSILAGDTTVTATGVAALGVGIKAEKASGPGNDKVSIITPALGLSATGTVNLLTVGYRWSDQPMPVDVGVGGGARGGYGLAGGIQLTFDPGGFSVQASGGVGAGASFDVFGVGFKTGGGQ